MGLIVSLTSYPPRINSVHLVVESLFKQTMQPDEIILYLSLEEFSETEDDLPDTLRELVGKRGFRIEWVEGNLKSHKKYYYTLQKYREDTVITVDDDTVYAESMISDLVKECQRFPYAISARRVRIVLKQENRLEYYRKWDGQLDEYADVPRMDLCAIGVGGVCYPPRTGSENWFRKEKIVSTVMDQDDLWLKYNEIIDNIPIVYAIPSQEDMPISSAEEECLSHINFFSGNDDCADALLKMMKTENPGYYERWFHNLMTWEEYAEQKKRYYSNILKTDFDKAQNVPIFLYGAGKIAERLLDRLFELRLTSGITAVVVSDKAGNPSELKGIEVRQLNEIDKGKRIGIIFGVNESNRGQIEPMLNEYNYCSIELNEQALARYFNIKGRWQEIEALYREK